MVNYVVDCCLYFWRSVLFSDSKIIFYRLRIVILIAIFNSDNKSENTENLKTRSFKKIALLDSRAILHILVLLLCAYELVLDHNLWRDFTKKAHSNRAKNRRKKKRPIWSNINKIIRDRQFHHVNFLTLS